MQPSHNNKSIHRNGIKEEDICLIIISGKWKWSDETVINIIIDYLPLIYQFTFALHNYLIVCRLQHRYMRNATIQIGCKKPYSQRSRISLCRNAKSAINANPWLQHAHEHFQRKHLSLIVRHFFFFFVFRHQTQNRTENSCTDFVALNYYLVLNPNVIAIEWKDHMVVGRGERESNEIGFRHDEEQLFQLCMHAKFTTAWPDSMLYSNAHACAAQIAIRPREDRESRMCCDHNFIV